MILQSLVTSLELVLYYLINKMMNVFFGKINLEEYQNLEREGLFFHNENYYWYKIEVTEDQAVLYDTCNRKVPIGPDGALQFGTAASAVSMFYRAKQDAEKTFQRKIREIEAVTEYYNTNE